MTEISTSLLNIEKGKETEIILNLEKAKTDYFHIDVMDGKFVERNTYDKTREISAYIKRISNLPQDVHLMVENVKDAVDDFASVEPNIITFHLEACKDENEVFKIINMIKENHIKVGIAIKPNTSVEEVFKFLPYVHMCLVMTVEPGKGGQTLISDMIEKISKLRNYVQENNLEIDIEADGGINLATCERVKSAGANILVSGTAILMARDYGNIIEEMKK